MAGGGAGRRSGLRFHAFLAEEVFDPGDVVVSVLEVARGEDFALQRNGRFDAFDDELAERAPVLIVGPCGTGKSHLAQALGHCAVRQGVDVVFTTCAGLTQSLHAARATGAYERKLASLARVPLLIIDDFGLKPLRPPADEDLHDLIAERYEQTATIVTSNLDFPEWDQAFPANRLLASATLDRLRHNAYCMVLDGQSYRAPKMAPTSPKSRPVAPAPKPSHP